MDAGRISADAEWVRAVLPRGALLESAAGSNGASLPDGVALVTRLVGDELEHRERLPFIARVARAARLVAASARVRRAARRTESRLRAAGLHTERVMVGRGGDGQAIGLGRRIGLSPLAFVVAFREPRVGSVFEEAKAAAERALGAASVVQRARVLASGVVMAELAAGDRFVLRVAGPQAAASARAAADVLDRLLASAPSAGVRDRLVEPVATGDLDAFRWWLEPMRPGRHPTRVGAALWESSIDFLAQLRAVPAPDEAATASAIAAHAEAVGPYLDEAGRRRLAAVEARLGGELSGIRLGWGHGDFHTANLLVEDGRLGTVLDWDAGGSAALPLLDLMHLMATARRGARRLSHGDRCVEVLWPLARAGGDARVASYCERIEMPPDRDQLLALSHAYWLIRIADDVRRFGDRVATPEWVERNIQRPLVALG